MIRPVLSSLPLWLICLTLPLLSTAQTKSTFEDLMLDPSASWNGISASYGDYDNLLEDSVFQFTNRFSRNDYGFGLYDSWYGISCSRMQDDTTAGIGNQYSAIAASGAMGSPNYAVFFLLGGSDTIRLTKAILPDSVYITNATYPYISMRDGDTFSRKFGGESGDDPDWFLLRFTGVHNKEVTDTVEFYLADFRDGNNANDYIVNDWTGVDLSPLDSVDRIIVSLSSSDVGDYGMNTPAYFCMDNICGVDFEDFEFSSGNYWNGNDALIGSYCSYFTSGNINFPNYYTINDYGTGLTENWTGFAYSNRQDDSTGGLINQYSAVTGSGVAGSSNYGLCFNLYQRDTITLIEPGTVSGLFVSNGTTGVQSMLYGDAYAKKFGGESGNDPDWFKLTIRGLYEDTCTDTVMFYLADYRFSDNESDYIIDDWEWVDLTSLGTVDRLEFSLSSSDTGPYGMNTPAFFFFDDINDQVPIVLQSIKDTVMYDFDQELRIELSGRYTDPDDEDGAMVYKLRSISYPELFSEVSFSGSELIMELSHLTGEAEIVLEAISGGHPVCDTFSVSVIHGQGIDTNDPFSVSIYPNPATNRLYVETDLQGRWQLSLFDLYGHEVLRDSPGKATEEIDISALNPGMYILKIQNDKVLKTYTLIIK